MAALRFELISSERGSRRGATAVAGNQCSGGVNTASFYNRMTQLNDPANYWRYLGDGEFGAPLGRSIWMNAVGSGMSICARAVVVCLNKRLGKRMRISIREQLYEQDAIIQQYEAFIQTISSSLSSIPCCFDGPLKMWLACQAILLPRKEPNEGTEKKQAQAVVFTFIVV